MSESKPTLEEDIERVLARIESAREGYRSDFSLRPDLARRMHIIGEQYTPQEIQVVDQEFTLSERIKAIYPVIHRANDMFVGTKQGDLEVDVQSFGETQVILEIFDNPYFAARYPDCGVIVDLPYAKSCLYTITRFRPTWKRADPRYDKRFVEKPWFIKESDQDACIDIHSRYFKIDCMPIEKFVEELMYGSSEPELRQSTLNHLLSLPDILGTYLDKKERGDLV